jgi:hypothetical protein
MYANKEERYDFNKFYIQGPFSRPWNNNFEDYNNSQSVLASGENLKQSESFIDQQTGKVRVTLEGVYPKPGDNALLGRGSSDVVLVENDLDASSSVLIRTGKYLGSGNENIPVVKNDNRGFLQLSTYDLENVDSGSDTSEKETFEDISTSMYVEWSIDNMSINSVDYDGSIRLYKLPRNNENTKVSNINENIDILDGLNIQPIYLLTFTGQTLEEASTIINSFIRGINEGKIKIDGYVDYPAQDGLVLENQFPFFYGPSKETYQYTTGSISSSLKISYKYQQIYCNLLLILKNGFS